MNEILLTNEDRAYLGLTPIESHWERMDFRENILLFDGNTIRKKISYEKKQYGISYFECDVLVETAENRTLVLPKTAKGKPKKLNYTATTTFTPFGVYFGYHDKGVIIANFTTQKTFFSADLEGEDNDYKTLQNWLVQWKKEMTEEDCKALEVFKTEKRKHQKYKEGDIFCFKMDKNAYGFGKIVIDVTKRRKTEAFKSQKNDGLRHLMGTALIVQIYHKIAPSPNIDLKELESCKTLPAQAVMDNKIYYDEHKIIGNLPITNADMTDCFLSVSRSISFDNPDYAYLQYGLIYKEIPLEKYQVHAKEHWGEYRSEGIGYGLLTETLQECIKASSNAPYWDKNHNDLRNPKNFKDKKEIFQLFGLDADLDYEGNLKLQMNK